MLQNIHSESSFDAVKSSNKPKAAPNEAANKGTSFQSHYSAADKHESAVSDAKQVANTDAADDAQATPSNDVSDQSTSQDTEVDQDRSANQEEDALAPEAAHVDILPVQQNRPKAAAISQGGVKDAETDISLGTNKNAEVAKSHPESSARQASESEKAEQPIHRSVAELRMAGLQQGADHQQAKTASANQAAQVVGQGTGQSPLVETPVPNENAEAGLKVGAAIASTQSSTQGSAPTMPESLQRVVAASQAGQAVPVATPASKPVKTGANAQTAQQVIEQALNAAGQEAEPELDPRAIRRGTEVTPNSPPTVTVPTPNNTVQINPAMQAVAQGAAVNADAMADSAGAAVLLDPIGFEPAGLSQLLTEAVMSPGTTHRPETPRLVAAQMAEALATKGERNIDIALSPEELGRVKMRVSTTDTSVVVAITTERPETNELMRRHINELSEEFRRMGFEDISFEFSGEGMSGDASEQDESQSNGSSGAQSNGQSADNVQEPEQQNLRLGETGLDMRI
ncbi:hypothetical protein DL239_05645 [Sedimentitalea sp. CY04]|uniref:Flagellar hook-length control protein-like C-terminal domain-containing protein n=1 Tax=Parasedimentitalea denitrificans TaxID=2211118 RepID=A0ABX0W4K2_9RHOB|nr:flagellar hook-length control protein FliK [Sedimentitalea sp. CY04]NIZ60457.1 hypothetical protein [Sedimentitalea sp. CY04]